jgi:hypothetical protein
MKKQYSDDLLCGFIERDSVNSGHKQLPLGHGFERDLVPADRIEDMGISEQMFIAHSECPGCADVSTDEACTVCGLLNTIDAVYEDEFQSLKEKATAGLPISERELSELTEPQQEEILADQKFFFDHKDEFARLKRLSKETDLPPREIVCRFPSLFPQLLIAI